MPEAYCVILTTAGSREEASRLSEMLVSRKLAACVQVLDIHSTYMWQGELKQEPEFLLLIKTASHLYKDVEAAIVEDHSYEVPEVIQIPVTRGLDRDLEWVTEGTGSAGRG